MWCIYVSMHDLLARRNMSMGFIFKEQFVGDQLYDQHDIDILILSDYKIVIML